MPFSGATFPKAFRLLRRYDYIRLSAGRPGYTGPAFLVIWTPNEFGYPRMGITASRKVGGAVVRNRIKRHLREFYRQQIQLLPPVDINIIVRRTASDMEAAALRAELGKVFRQIGSF